MKRILFLLCLAMGLMNATAQTGSENKDHDFNLLKAALKGWHVRLGAGFNLGGTSPMPLPRSIRAIDGYNPNLCIAIEGAAEKKFGGSDFGLQIGIRLENKGMSTDATVKNYHMEAVNADGSGEIKGAFTGHVKTDVDNRYLSFPVLCTYDINKRWRVSIGPYFAWMFDGKFTGEAYGKDIFNEDGIKIGTDAYIRDQNPTGEKAEVTRATYDFSNDLRKFHWGIQAGGEFCADQIAIDGTLIEAGRREATRMNGVDFGERDEFFDDRTEFFSFGLSRLNCFVIEQLRGERIEHGIAMRSCTAEMTAGFTMSHSSIPNYWLKIRREVPIYRPTFRG